MLNRDTKNFYTDNTPDVAPGLIEFVEQYAGHKILDAAAATGSFVNACNQLGYDASGIEINDEYVKVAQKKNFPVTKGDAGKLTFADNSFDTVLLFEILEHIADEKERQKILREAKRVARKNVLITTPNSNHLDLLYNAGLTYEHMLDRDHKVFWNDESIEQEISAVFEDFIIEPRENIESRFINQLFKNRLAKFTYRLLHDKNLAVNKFYFRYFVVGNTSSNRE